MGGGVVWCGKASLLFSFFFLEKEEEEVGLVYVGWARPMENEVIRT